MFADNIDGLQKQLDTLNENKVELTLDFEQAKRELKETRKHFLETGEASDKFVEAQEKYNRIANNLKLITKTADATQKSMEGLNNTMASSSKSKIGDFASRLGQAGAFKMVGDVAAQVAGAYAGSRYGEEGGTMFSSMLSGGASGAAVGSMFGPVGTAIGGLAGGALGLVQGGTQIAQKKDDAFKSYYQGQYEGIQEQERTMMASGSAIAAGRETSLISFSTLLGGQDIASGFLDDVRKMANTTPFLYEDLTKMSKTLKTFNYGTDEILPMIQKVGDAGAALGMLPEDMNWVTTSIGRMKSTNKASLEYINPLMERGIDVYGYLSQDKGISREEAANMVAKGQVTGQYLAETVLNAMGTQFAGSMEAQSRTMTGLQSTLQGSEDEMANAMGEGYNEQRKMGLERQIAFLDTETEDGRRMADANRAIGAWKASLENMKEELEREYITKAMDSQDYKDAEREGDAAAMGRIVAQAKTKAQNEYNASEGAQELLASERTLISSIRNDAALNDDYWNAGYSLGQEFTKGRAAAMADNRNDEYKQGLLGENSGYGTPNIAGYVDSVAYMEKLKSQYFAPAQYEGPVGNTINQNVSLPNLTIQKEVDANSVLDMIYRGLQTQAAASAPYKKG